MLIHGMSLHGFWFMEMTLLAPVHGMTWFMEYSIHYQNYLELALPVMCHHRRLMTGRASFWLTELRGKGTKLCEGEGSKLGEPCPKVWLSQDRLPIEPSFFLSWMYEFMNVSFHKQINSMNRQTCIKCIP